MSWLYRILQSLFRSLSSPKAPALATYQESQRIFRRRLIQIMGLLAFLCIILLGKLIDLTTFKHQHELEKAEQNYVRILPIEPQRGKIFDVHGHILAENQPSYNLAVLPYQVQNLDDTVWKLDKFLALSPEAIQQFYRHYNMTPRYQPAILLRNLDEDAIATYSVNEYHLPGTKIIPAFKRHYPLKEITGNLLGYISYINQGATGNSLLGDFRYDKVIGHGGIEAYYNGALKGVEGYKEIQVNAFGHVNHVLRTVPAITGCNLTLTIDRQLQTVAYQALGHNQGAVVAIDPRNGHVLAAVSKPGFDNNLFIHGLSQKQYNALVNSPYHPLFNRLLNGQYPLASTIKPFIGLLGLDSGTITPADRVYDPGYFQLPHIAHKYHNWKRSGLGWVNLEKAIIESDDTYFYHLAYLLGIEPIHNFLIRFGYNQLSHIDLPGEMSGLIPSPSWKEAHLRAPWYPGDTVNTGIGQGYTLATPIQLATATATLAMHGKRYEPVLLDTIDCPNAPTLHIPATHVKTVQLKNPAHWNTIIHDMQEVVDTPHGTAFRIHPGLTYTMAGKTGTAQVFSSSDNQADQALMASHRQLRNDSLFIAFAPVNHPQIAIAVIIEHAEGASTVARKVIDADMASHHVG